MVIAITEIRLARCLKNYIKPVYLNPLSIKKSSVLYYTTKEAIMSKVVHTSEITITREEGPTRKAVIKGFSEPVFYGVHGGVKSFTVWNHKRSMQQPLIILSVELAGE